MEKARVLIVDDSRAIQTIIRRGLAQVDSVEMETRVANDGVEAFDIARSWSPDLVISDWHMPNKNGLELLLAINQEMLGIKLGFVTSETCKGKLDEARASGAKFIVNKPFNMDELVAQVLPTLQEQAEVTVYDEQETDKVRLPDVNRISQMLASKCPFTVNLEAIPAIPPEDIKPPFVLAFYNTADNSRVTALCLIDLQAAWLIGAAGTKTQGQKLRDLLALKKLPGPFVASCESMAKALGATFTCTADNAKPLAPSRVNLIAKPFPKLKFLLSTAATDRVDLNVSIPGYGGSGRIIMVTS